MKNINNNNKTIKYTDLVLIRELTRDGRISFNELAKLTGLAYTSIRERILRLRERGLLDIKPMVSPKIYGNYGALLKIKTKAPGRIVDLLSKCNRVLSLMTNREYVIVTLVAPSYIELLFLVDSIIRRVDVDIEEYSIEYGKVPEGFLIPLRNPEPACNNCKIREIYGCRGCLPVLRIKGR